MGFSIMDLINSISDLTEAMDLVSSVMPHAVDIDILHLELICAKMHINDALQQIKWMKEFDFTTKET